MDYKLLQEFLDALRELPEETAPTPEDEYAFMRAVQRAQEQ